MRTTERVLNAIKAECDRQTKLVEIRPIEKIAVRTGITKQALALYLSELKEKGYIKYSVEEDFIHLTPEGRKTFYDIVT